MTHLIGGPVRRYPVPTFKLLDQMITVLGSTKTTLFPLLESTDDLVRSYKENYHTLTPTSGGPGFDPFKHAGGVHSYLFDPAYSMYLKGVNSTDHSFKTSAKSEDDPFSVGMFVLPFDVASVTLMAKYDDNTKREWKFHIHSDGKMKFDLYDENVTASEIATSTTAVTANKWTFLVHTYDGAEAAPVVAFYQDAVVDDTVGGTQTNAYINMEELTAPLTIGADLSSGVPVNQFNGRIALPFICGKKLTAANVTTLYGIGKALLGL